MELVYHILRQETAKQPVGSDAKLSKKLGDDFQPATNKINTEIVFFCLLVSQTNCALSGYWQACSHEFAMNEGISS